MSVTALAAELREYSAQGAVALTNLVTAQSECFTSGNWRGGAIQATSIESVSLGSTKAAAYANSAPERSTVGL